MNCDKTSMDFNFQTSIRGRGTLSCAWLMSHDDGCVHMSHNDLNFFLDTILNRHSVQISGSVCCPRELLHTQLPFRHTGFDRCLTNPKIPNGHNPSIPKMSYFSTVFRFNRPRKGPSNALLGERRWVFVARGGGGQVCGWLQKSRMS